MPAVALDDRLARARAVMAAASAAPVALAEDRLVPVLPPLRPVLPHGGLVRGQTVVCRGEAAWSLGCALAADATRAGSWVMVVGLPSLGLQAAAELGVALERTVVVAPPPSDQWAVVLAAALDGADVVLAPSDAALSPADARRLQARLRTRGGALVLIDRPATAATTTTPFVADLVMSAVAQGWEGPGEGDGRLVRRRVSIDLDGRRARSGRRHDMHLPDADGGLALATLHRESEQRAG